MIRIIRWSWENRTWFYALVLGIIPFILPFCSPSNTSSTNPKNSSNEKTEQNQKSNNSGLSIQIKSEGGDFTIINNENKNLSLLSSPSTSPSTPSSLNLPVKDPINTFKNLLLGWYRKLD